MPHFCGNIWHDLPGWIVFLSPSIGAVWLWLRTRLARPKCGCGCGHEEGEPSREQAR